MTRIEEALFLDDSVHEVVMLALSNESLLVEVQPLNDPSVRARAEFSSPVIVSVDTSYAEPDEAELPWEIIGFDSDALSDDSWSFCLHAEGGEWAFESTWPAIRRVRP
jgi:hypothetical protein